MLPFGLCNVSAIGFCKTVVIAPLQKAPTADPSPSYSGERTKTIQKCFRAITVAINCLISHLMVAVIAQYDVLNSRKQSLVVFARGDNGRLWQWWILITYSKHSFYMPIGDIKLFSMEQL